MKRVNMKFVVQPQQRVPIEKNLTVVWDEKGTDKMCCEHRQHFHSSFY